MKLNDYTYIYFLGIGGIGMSALARWFKGKGFRVWGYDKTRTALTEALEQEGVMVHYEDNLQQLPKEILQHKQQTLVVFTPAIPAGHQEWAYLKAHGYTIKKRSEVLGIITAAAYTVAVAGTHGKTTTSAIITHLLHQGGVDCSAFLGGIATNLNSNLLIGKSQTEKEVVVVEADEYDRSFLTLYPQVAVVTSADPDHLDIYGNEEQMLLGYQQFASQIKAGGLLLLQAATNPVVAARVADGVRVIKYNLNNAEAYVQNLRINGRWFEFDVVSPFGNITGLRLGLPGYHNVENTLAAILVAQALQMPAESIKTGVASFAGVKRRFEFIYEGEGKVYIDDYAHHPKEIEAFMTSLRALYPHKRIKVLFQPHLFTRTRDLAKEFAESLRNADELVLLDIYPAREQPIAGVTSALILDQANCQVKELLPKEAILANLFKNGDFDVLATLGAGDIDTLVKPIRNILEKNRYGLE